MLHKYGGKEWNTTTSTYDFEARYLSPAFHRFTTMDPLAEKYYSISPYAYCAGNPVNLVDPDGPFPHVIGGAVIGGLVGGGLSIIEGKRGKEFWGGGRWWWKFRRKMTQVVSYESDPPFRRKVTHLS